MPESKPVRLTKKQQETVQQHLGTAHSTKRHFRGKTPLHYDDLGGLCELALCKAVAKYVPSHKSQRHETRGRTSTLHNYIKKMCGWHILMAAKSERLHHHPGVSIDNFEVSDGKNHLQEIEDRIDHASELQPLLECLTPYEKRVIRGFFGFDGAVQTLGEIAAKQGCSPQRIFEVKLRALAKMRQKAEVK